MTAASMASFASELRTAHATSPYLSSSPPSKAPSLHDSARGSPAPEDDSAIDSFRQLVTDINTILGPSNGIDSAGIDVEELKAAMQDYASSEYEWQKYAFADPSRAYTRNLVDAGNGKSNLLILVWTPGKGSPIHDHANAHCIMKVLKGSLRETVYCWPCESGESSTDCATSPTSLYPSTQHTCSLSTERTPSAPPRIKRSTVYTADEVTYMSDRLGLHRVENPSEGEVAVSLHLYTPPNAAKHGCHIFDAATGKRSHVQQCHFYSEFGVRKDGLV